MSDIEDGECSDTDSENDFQPSSTNLASNVSGYRQQIPQIRINSANTSSSDDESQSYFKRLRNSGQKDVQSDVPFVNPLLSSQGAPCPGGLNKRKNHVWGSVIMEQILSQDIQMVGVYKCNDRSVETYDYTKAKKDDRPIIESVPVDNRDDIFDMAADNAPANKSLSRKRKNRSFKRTKQSQMQHLDQTMSRMSQQVVDHIVTNFSEEKVDLFTRIVEAVGVDKSVEIYNQTVDMERAGGMLTNDGLRRRTPGGVFIQLLKSDSSISESTIKPIFENDQKEWLKTLKAQRKIKKAARKKWLKQQRESKKADKNITSISQQTITSGNDQQVISEDSMADQHITPETSMDSNYEFEVTEPNERPANPEPQEEDQCLNAEEDEDDEEDIAVAIQKAKAAIMKKKEMINQAEMVTQLKCVTFDHE